MGFRRKLAPDGTPLESVDELPPWRQLIPLGLQHVLAMYAGAVAVPLVVGGALIGAGKLNPGDLGCLVTAGVSAHDAVRENPQVHAGADGSPAPRRIPEQQGSASDSRR